MTICPPKDTNTALNHDLLRLNSTFSPSIKDKLEKEIDAIFFQDDNTRYLKTLLQITNIENLEAVYNGFQTIPMHLGQMGFQVKLSGSSGEITTR